VDDPFDLVPKASTNNHNKQAHHLAKPHSFNVTSSHTHHIVENEHDVRERLRQMGNKKGISSEDLFGAQEKKSDEVIARYQALSGAKAISSDMFFNKAEDAGSDDHSG